MFNPKKIWTLEEAREVFPQIKKITEGFHAKVESLVHLLTENIYPENEMESMEDEITDLLKAWNFTLQEFEVDVKGIWLVDFDNGNGYYCWKVGEEDLLYEHTYEDGFAGRRLIERNKQNGDY
ncbi:MAG TPA: DUF2203 domain-containing protein [Leptospiraceae bacterium]|nr:DUF2203 domain-containing protein [Leptospiraceae bacterium]HMW07442.1 DUF2203 domain-containing protein [Leptospiraceae bacterium]HMX32205.1 DUF2203 domain-containing protein [Leptospiraceae bacterium]HMY33021.1 DUF2203 domain-containing protein [Leptospiraceae bacterium]HMZ63521.1 DUF2203 domain-containing protein [Leptospiraceae bacterium]